MRAAQRNLGIVASISLMIYVFALWNEAAYHAGGIGFLEELTWPRMIAAYRVTTIDHVVRLEILPMGAVAVMGMLVAIATAPFPLRTVPTWAWSIYSVVLLISGGWIGLAVIVTIPFLGLPALDGEFLDEMLARLIASGIWTALVLVFLVHRIVRAKRINGPKHGERRVTHPGAE
jgi:hypothetical protein